MYNFDTKKETGNCIEWIKNYFEKEGKGCKALIAISGGKDSSVGAALCVEALGKENVVGILLPDGDQPDIEFSYNLVNYLGIDHMEINIYDSLSCLYENIPIKLNESAFTNTPARMRMLTLYALKPVLNARVCNTSNLSEDWIGWCTQWGDDCGDFAPLKNFTSDEVILIGEELGLPKHLTHKVPIDGLQPKTDEQAFGFSYSVLNEYIRNIREIAPVIKEKIERLHENSRFKFKRTPSYEPNLERNISEQK